MKKYKIPYVVGAFKQIYKPSPDVYKGDDSESFKSGDYCNVWIPNDFSIIKDDQWHMVGITHPKPADFTDAFNCSDSNCHESEHQLFHCTTQAKTFAEIMNGNIFKDEEKILYPDERKDETENIFAPAIIKYENQFRLVYSPSQIRYADTKDFAQWDRGVLFDCKEADGRDPFVYYENDTYYILFTEGKMIKLRTSIDMKVWTEEEVLMECPYSNGWPESSFMMKIHDAYYLFWSIYDGRNGVYDFRTFVFVSDSIEGFKGNEAPLTILPAHAPEIVKDVDGKTYLLSVYYPTNGVSAIELKWR